MLKFDPMVVQAQFQHLLYQNSLRRDRRLRESDRRVLQAACLEELEHALDRVLVYGNRAKA